MSLNKIQKQQRFTKNILLQKGVKKQFEQSFYYLMYLSINFLWNSFLKASLIKPASFFRFSSVPLAQFLKTTSSSHLKIKLCLFEI